MIPWRIVREKIFVFIREYGWVTAALLFFALWKIFLVGIMWEGRSLAPETDDSYEYIAHIASVSECRAGILCEYPGVSINDHSGFSYLSYRFFLGTIGKIFNLAPETTYRVGFYIGTLLLVPTLLFLLLAFTKNRHLLAWTVFFLAFYHGTGETHGFFWVVPSFFSTLLFFWLFLFTFQKERYIWWVAGLFAIAHTFSHPMSVYLVFILPLSAFLLFAFSRKIDTGILKRSFFIVAVSVIASFGQEYFLERKSQTNYYGIVQSAQHMKEALTLEKDSRASKIPTYSIAKTGNESFLSQRIETLRVAYFRYTLPHWTVIFAFFFAFWILLKKKEFLAVSFFVSSLSFFVGATFFHEFGFRSAVILWPATFIFFAFASWHGLSLVSKIKSRSIRRSLSSLGILAILAFLGGNALLAVAFNANANSRYRYNLDENFSKYLLENTSPSDRINLSPILVRTEGGASLYFRNVFVPLSGQPLYFATIDPSLEDRRADRSRGSLILPLATGIAKIFGVSPENPSPPKPLKTPPGYKLDRTFGSIKIYKKLP